MKKSVYTLTILSALAFGSTAVWGQCVGTNLLTNGGFEDPVLPDGGTGVAGTWTVTGTAEALNPTAASFTAESGSNVGRTGGMGVVGEFCQQVTASMTLGATYCVDAPAGELIGVPGASHDTFLRRTSDTTVRCSDTATVLSVNTLTSTGCSFATQASSGLPASEACVAKTIGGNGEIVWDDIVATPVELQSFEIE